MNTTDPIIPGSSAAGIRIGDPIQAIVARERQHSDDRFHGVEKYTFEAVTLWVRDGRVSQIGVRVGYTGTLAGGIGIGSAVRDVERVFGRVAEDSEDNLVVVGATGWCFETATWVRGRGAGANRDAVITEIFVFAAVV